MEHNDNKGGVGCFIFFVLFVIGSIIYMLNDTSSDEFAEMGQFIFLVISAVITYFVFKYFTNTTDKNDKNEQSSGCTMPLLICAVLLVLFMVVFNAIGTDYDTNVGMGKIFMIVISIIVAIYLWIHLNNE